MWAAFSSGPSSVIMVDLHSETQSQGKPKTKSHTLGLQAHVDGAISAFCLNAITIREVPAACGLRSESL